MASRHDYIIIGAGHNGLVCANYLAKARKSVLIVEARNIVGGAAVTEEVFEGYKFSRFSYVLGVFRQKVIDELFPDNWREHVPLYKVESTLCIPGKKVDDFVLLSHDADISYANIKAYAGEQEAENYTRLMLRIADISHSISPLLDTAPIESLWCAFKKLPLSKLPRQQKIDEVMTFLSSSCANVLDQWLENDRLKAALSYSGTIGMALSPYSPGTAFSQLHHVANTIKDEQGEQKFRYYPRGGNGSITQYLAQLAQERGVIIRLQAKVKRILVDNNTAQGIELANGQVCYARKGVISNATYNVTFKQLIDEKIDLPASFARGLKVIPYQTNCTKINLVIDKIPQFTCLKNVLPLDGNFTQNCHAAAQYLLNVILAGDSMEHLHQCYLAAEQKKMSTQPIIQMLIPSLVDDSLTPDGSEHLVAMLFTQYTPYDVKGGWDETNRQQFMSNVLRRIDSYAPGFSESIVHQDVLFPPDIETVLNMTGGNIFHGALTLDNIFSARPMPRHSQYQTPIENLYSCSAANHPGGGVSGGPGRNCAQAIL